MPQLHDPVRSLNPWEPNFANPEDTLREVARNLSANQIGALLVRTPDDQLGLISERDVARALADGADPDEVWAADVMSADLRVADPDDAIVDVALEMLDAGVRHIVLVEGSRATGVVSMRDVLRPLVDAGLTLPRSG